MTKVNGNRKLPPYDELYDLVVNRRISYTDVAAQYGVHFTAVSGTLKRDRLKMGLPWPIDTDKGSRISRSLQDIYVDATVIRELLRESYQERQANVIPDQVWVSSRSVQDPEHRSRRRYHVDGCRLLDRMSDLIQVATTVASREGYKPCGTCCRVSVAKWGEELGVDVSAAHLYRLVSPTDDPNVRRIRKSTAVKLLRAIGEEPHERLTSWKSKKTVLNGYIPKALRNVDNHVAA